MISIKKYKQYWEHILTEVPDLKAMALVATEEGLGKKIKDQKDFPLLVVIIPSSDPRSPDPDNIRELNQGIIFILYHRAASDQTDDNYVEDMDNTQLIMKAVKEAMHTDMAECELEFHPEMKELDTNSFHMDPEYNFLGCHGWSLSFQFLSTGY